ncbi:cytidylyl-2-hydroxypropylphosphonate hydrolase [Streptomyces xantholiticus]
MTGTGGPARDTGRTDQYRTDPERRARWEPGDHILWRYRGHASGPAGRAFHICRPVTVVQDTDELLAVWMAPGTECVKPQLADGTPVHEEPLATRYTAPRTTARARWTGNGVLKLAQPGLPWSVWLFWEHGWQFRSWYVNLEEPRTRWSGGVDSEDHFLDISVYPDRSWLWRDEDEFDQAQRVGLMDARTARAVQEAGRAAVEVIRSWGAPFCDGWEHWRPDPAWRVPVLPADWDRLPGRQAA